MMTLASYLEDFHSLLNSAIELKSNNYYYPNKETNELMDRHQIELIRKKISIANFVHPEIIECECRILSCHNILLMLLVFFFVILIQYNHSTLDIVILEHILF